MLAVTFDYSVVLTIGLIINGISMILCPIIASYKGRSVAGWFFAGLFLSIIALIIIACVSGENTSTSYTPISEFEKREFDGYVPYTQKTVVKYYTQEEADKELANLFTKLRRGDITQEEYGKKFSYIKTHTRSKNNQY